MIQTFNGRNFIMKKNISLILISILGIVQTMASVSQVNELKMFNKLLDQFAGEKVSVLYRGINSAPAAKDIVVEDIQNKAMYCQEAYRLAGGFDSTLLDKYAKQVADSVNSLKRNRGYYAFQQAYSNNYEQFMNEYLPSHSPFRQNPMLSFSFDINHPLYYTCGLKGYHKNAIHPDYEDGSPKNAELGKFSVIVLDEAAIEELEPCNVPLAHSKGNLKIYSHYANNILAENEVSIPGYVPEECICAEMTVRVPNFDCEYSEDIHKNVYGLTELRFKNRKEALNSEDGLIREKATAKIIREMIKQKQDAKGVYKNSLEYRIRERIEKNLEKNDCTLDNTLINNDFN